MPPPPRPAASPPPSPTSSEVPPNANANGPPLPPAVREPVRPPDSRTDAQVKAGLPASWATMAQEVVQWEEVSGHKMIEEMQVCAFCAVTSLGPPLRACSP